MSDYSVLKDLLEQSKKSRGTRNEFVQGPWALVFESHGWDHLFQIFRCGVEKVNGIVNDKSFHYTDPNDKETNNLIQDVMHEVLPDLGADNAWMATEMPQWQKNAIDKAIVSEYPWAKLQDFEAFSEELSATADDTNDFLLQFAYDARAAGSEDILDTLRGEILGSYLDEIDGCAYDLLDSAGVSDDYIDPAEAERCLDYLRERIRFEPPYDHYLNQDMKVNIMVSTPEERSFTNTLIHKQYAVIRGEHKPSVLSIPSGLSWLVEQQGHTMEELREVHKQFHDLFERAHTPSGFSAEIDGKVYKDYSAAYDALCQTLSKFLVSVCQELDNHTYDMGVLTVLSKMGMYGYADLSDKDKNVVLPKDATVGIFNPWNGSGSVFDIELEKELVIPTKTIWETQIEGAHPDFGYTVDNSYGLVGSCWKPIDDVFTSSNTQSLADKLNDVQTRAKEKAEPSPSYIIQSEQTR